MGDIELQSPVQGTTDTGQAVNPQQFQALFPNDPTGAAIAMRGRRLKNVLDRIDNHERICRLMQKQTFERIDRMETHRTYGEMIIGGCIAVVLAVLSNHM